MSEQIGDTHTCLNCGATLVGQYCGQCGQRAASRLISLWELLRDAFGDLFELDSRLWRTLVPLLVRPGILTRDYLIGRRARYMPPFRMYLVLSLVFFIIAFFDPRQQLAILYEPGDSPDAELVTAERAPINEETREILEELVRDGVLDEEILGPDGPLGPAADVEPAAPTQGDAQDQADEVDGNQTDSDNSDNQADDDESGLNLTIDDDDLNCTVGGADFDFAPEFIQRRFSEERLTQVCKRVIEVGAAGVFAALLDNVPAALIILLPLMAFVLKFLYPLSRRYYVEHLLFFVHFHAFLFVLLTLQILWARLIALVGFHDAVSVLPIVATSFYIPVYLYKSMRRVYEQGRILTVLKFLTLSITYMLGFTLMMFGALLIAVFSV
ncbi:MAG: DUF3667 domain-containing protein [Gammaproteobacteria bacterium]|nr:DUF3667 domain-containing protein [Gammaproteobacteria bacterium]